MTKQAALAKVRKFCLSLPESWEKKAWSAPTFRAGKRMFAMFDDGHHGQDRYAVWCNAPLDFQRRAVADDPENFFVPAYVGKSGWVGVRLDRGIAWSRVEAVLRQAHAGSLERKTKRG